MPTYLKKQKIHAYLGLFLLIPLLAWSVTGAVFLLKPGYGSAYERVNVKTYPITDRIIVNPSPLWEEFRILKTIMGTHLLVKVEGEWSQLDIVTYLPMPDVGYEDEMRLLNEAISINKDRYGVIEKRVEAKFVTTTGVELSLDWGELKITQKGNDTTFINTLYKIHYLQWFGVKPLNTAFGVLGLFCLILLTVYGVASYAQRKGRLFSITEE